jgi:cysteine-rich repeat protein
MRAFAPVSAAVLEIALLVGLATPSQADIDLSGKWYDPANPTGKVEIVQTGSDVTVTWSDGSTVYTGTFDQSAVVATSEPRRLFLQVLGEGDFLRGGVFVIGSPTGTSSVLSRCECDDENLDDGDGCDSECRVEECYTCTGQPSVCSPSADSAPCDDRNDCTTGETCTAGTCGAGAPISPCFELDGPWRAIADTHESLYGPAPASAEDVFVVQHDGVVLLLPEGSDTGAMPSYAGTIDRLTGELSYESTTGTSFCGSPRTFDGTVDSSGNSFEGMFVYIPFTLDCWSRIANGRGVRCDADAGCDLADCTGYADGTPCDDGNVCLNRETCIGGACIGLAKCLLCESCDETGLCKETPEPDCRPSTSSTSSQLQLNDGPMASRDRIRWMWKRGEATSFAELGDPDRNAMALCIFDGDELIYRYDPATDAACETPPCWKEGAGKIQFNSQPLKILMKSGDEGRAVITIKGKDVDLENILGTPFPLPLPLRTQLHIDNGSCFEASFGASGVKTNEVGEFKGKGGLE